MLAVIDDEWKENLRAIDELRHSVQNASYEQKDPLVIFKLESVQLFDAMINRIFNRTVSILMRGQIPMQDPSEVQQAPSEQQMARQRRPQYRESRTDDLHDEAQQTAAHQDTRDQAQHKPQPYIAEKLPGRNDPCPCGSGKKFKNCHGKNLFK